MSTKKTQLKVETKLITATPEIFEVIRKVGIFVPTKSAKNEIEDMLFQIAYDSEISCEQCAEAADIFKDTPFEGIFEAIGDRIFKVRPFEPKPVVKNVKEKL